MNKIQKYKSTIIVNAALSFNYLTVFSIYVPVYYPSQIFYCDLLYI